MWPFKKVKKLTATVAFIAESGDVRIQTWTGYTEKEIKEEISDYLSYPYSRIRIQDKEETDYITAPKYSKLIKAQIQGIK